MSTSWSRRIGSFVGGTLAGPAGAILGGIGGAILGNAWTAGQALDWLEEQADEENTK